jgi:hypothetical protein
MDGTRKYIECEFCHLNFDIRDMFFEGVDCGPICNYCFGDAMNPEWRQHDS